MYCAAEPGKRKSKCATAAQSKRKDEKIKDDPVLLEKRRDKDRKKYEKMMNDPVKHAEDVARNRAWYQKLKSNPKRYAVALETDRQFRRRKIIQRSDPRLTGEAALKLISGKVSNTLDRDKRQEIIGQALMYYLEGQKVDDAIKNAKKVVNSEESFYKYGTTDIDECFWI